MGDGSHGVPSTLMLVDAGLLSRHQHEPEHGADASNADAALYQRGRVRAFLCARATTGATAHNIAMSYTNQSATAGRTLPVTVAATASAIVPHIVHSGTAANNYGPFLPMAQGDTGIQSVQTVTSRLLLVLLRPLRLSLRNRLYRLPWRRLADDRKRPA